MKATEKYFSVVLFIMLYKVVLSFETVAPLSSTILQYCLLRYFTLYIALLRL